MRHPDVLRYLDGIEVSELHTHKWNVLFKAIC